MNKPSGADIGNAFGLCVSFFVVKCLLFLLLLFIFWARFAILSKTLDADSRS